MQETKFTTKEEILVAVLESTDVDTVITVPTLQMVIMATISETTIIPAAPVDEDESGEGNFTTTKVEEEIRMRRPGSMAVAEDEDEVRRPAEVEAEEKREENSI